MKKEELLQLKELYMEEYRKRIRLNELFRNTAIIEFLKLTDNQNMLEENKDRFSLEADKIFFELMHNRKSIELSGSSNIYFIYHEYADSRGRKAFFRNIENYDINFGEERIDEGIDEFEKENDVLDPDNDMFIKDGPRVVQSTFFLESFVDGPDAAKRKILNLYGNLRNKSNE